MDKILQRLVSVSNSTGPRTFKNRYHVRIYPNSYTQARVDLKVQEWSVFEPLQWSVVVARVPSLLLLLHTRSLCCFV